MPTANGNATGALTVASSDAGSAVTALSGSTGGGGAVQLQPSVLNFSATGVGTSSGAQTVTVTNTGTVQLSALALAATGGFQLTANTCPSSLAAGASCTVGVLFNPARAGTQNGSLSATGNELALAQQVVLSGMGFDFTIGTSGASSQSVASGQTANYTLVLTPMSGSSGTFAFACGSLPANAVCSFNPSSASVNANMTGNVTVQVVTGNATASLHRPAASPWRVMPLLCGLLLLPVSLSKKRRVLLLVALLAILVGGAASCSGSGGGGGSGSKGGSGSNTPAGTYSIPVTATSNGISHQTIISLTVD